jgi:hypothetical protein
LTALVGVIYVIARYSFLAIKREGNSLRNFVLGSGLIMVFTFPAVPIYIALAPGVIAAQHQKLAGAGSLMRAIFAMQATAFDLPTFWEIGFALALVAPVTVMTTSHRLAILTASFLPVVALLVWSGESRLAYLAPVAIVFGLAAWWHLATRLSTWARRTIDAAVVTFVLLDVVIGSQHFAFDRDMYTLLTPGVVQGFDQLRAHSRAQDVIAVSPTVNDWELGWWVEGAARRRAIYAGNPIWLTYADEKSRNAIANRVFSPDASVSDSLRQAREAGAEYVFVDKQWSAYRAWSTRGLKDTPNRIIYENEAVLIIATARD